MEKIRVSRLTYDNPITVGYFSKDRSVFTYETSYLESQDAVPLSLSLPLREQSFTEPEFRPYFEGLLAEGVARSALAAQIGTREDNYLDILAVCGRDCIGDLIVEPENEARQREEALEIASLEIESTKRGAIKHEAIGHKTGKSKIEQEHRVSLSYEPISQSEIAEIFSSFDSVAAENLSSRLSLAGTQNKIGLAHDPNTSLNNNWLRPLGFAATTHILKTSHVRDIPEIEYLCACAAKACGLDVAKTDLIENLDRVVAVKRFDREVSSSCPSSSNAMDKSSDTKKRSSDEKNNPSKKNTGSLDSLSGSIKFYVKRLHQEDFTQALGVTSGSKYAELPGGSAATIAKLIRSKSSNPAHDLAAFARSLLFSYAIGNCDAHLKNYSIILRPATFSLAPAYDLICTTWFPNLSREVAMSYGGVKDIDEITPACLAQLARDLGMTTSYLRTLAQDITENLLEAINAAGEGAYGFVLESTPYVADNLLEDIQPRIEILRHFCRGEYR